jgi:hypothetical protein
MTCSFEANKNPKNWPQWLNDLYISCHRMFYTVGAMYLMISMFLGHFNCGLRSLCNPYFRMLGRATFLGALISPVVICLLYLGSERALFLTFPTIITIGTGNIVAIFIFAVILFVIVEFPLNKLIETLITSKLSHEHILADP